MSHGLELSREQLREWGWASWDLDTLGESEFISVLLAAARSLGRPVPHRTSGSLCQKLQPTDKRAANPRSLSRQYSIGEFPLHVDMAHWITPCRYVLLGCVDPGAGRRATTLLDVFRLNFPPAVMDLLYSAPFRVLNGRKSFFATIFSRDRAFIRFDPGCMAPISSEGSSAQEAILKNSSNVESIAWRAGRVLLIDNWRVLHGRSGSVCGDGERILLRVLIQ